MERQHQEASSGSTSTSRMAGPHGSAFLVAYFTSEKVMKRVMDSICQNPRLSAMSPRAIGTGWQLTTAWF